MDSSLLRNDFSYSVAKRMNLNYSFTGKYIDLYVDGKYNGVVLPYYSGSSLLDNIDDPLSIRIMYARQILCQP